MDQKKYKTSCPNNQHLLHLRKQSSTTEWTIDASKITFESVLSKSHTNESMKPVTYKATYASTHIAVKVLSSDQMTDSIQLLIMHAEADILSQLCHPNIASLLGASITHQGFIIATEFLPRGSLEDLLPHSNQTSTTSNINRHCAFSWSLDLLRAVEYMHHSHPPVAHRDLRPGNLHISASGALKLAGFGSARLLAAPPSPPSSPVDRPVCARNFGYAQSALDPSRVLPHQSPLHGLGWISASTGPSRDSDEEPPPPVTRYSPPEQHPAWRPLAPAAAECCAGHVPVRVGDDRDRQGDVYSAAVIVWAILAGRAPHARMSEQAAAAAAADPATRLRPDARAAGGRGAGAAAAAAALEAAWAHAAERRPEVSVLRGAVERAWTDSDRPGPGCGGPGGCAVS
jgi:serine/threonine protein kinase